jgi:hypothetical protein
MGGVADVSAVHATFIFKVEVYRLVLLFVGLYRAVFLKFSGTRNVYMGVRRTHGPPSHHNNPRRHKQHTIVHP